LSTQSIYTPAKAAQLLKMTEEEVLDHLRSGRLRGTFMPNLGNFVIAHEDLVAFAKGTHDTSVIRRVDRPRVLLAERENRLQDLLRLELGRNGCEVKIATTGKEIRFHLGEFRPHLVCMPLAAATRAADPLAASLKQARTACKAIIIIYHDYLPELAETEGVASRIRSVGADACVGVNPSIRPLVDCVLQRLGLEVKGPGPGGPSGPTALSR
jgi:hypothetical protein